METHFRVASVSKQFTAMAIYRLHRLGKLNLEEAMAQYFEDLPQATKSVQIKYLLNHTSGLVDYESYISSNQKKQLTDQDVLNIISSVDSVYFDAGAKFHYSNTAYCLLTLIVEKVSGLAYRESVKQLIFDPLKIMTATVYIMRDKKVRAFGYRLEKAGFSFVDQSVTSVTKRDGGVYISTYEYLKWLGHKSVLID